MKYRRPGPSQGDTDFVTPRGSWNPGDSHVPGRAQGSSVQRLLRFLHLYPRRAARQSPMDVSFGKSPKDSARVLTSCPVSPQTRAWPSSLESHVSEGLGQEQNKGFWRKEHPAGGLKSVLGLVNRPREGDRGSEAGPGPASLQGQRPWRCGKAEPGTMFFFLKHSRLFGMDFQPGVYSICSRVHDHV